MSVKTRVEKLEVKGGDSGGLAARLERAFERQRSGEYRAPTKEELEAELAQCKPDSMQARLCRAFLRAMVAK